MDILLKLLNDVQKSCWSDNTNIDEIIYASNLAYKNLTKNKTKRRKLYRIAGQSGSGKTSTLFDPLVLSLEEKNINPVKLGVRSFAKYHPKYKQLIENFGSGEIREKTNGFALKCLILTLFKLFKNGYFIVLDVTFLMPSFERYLHFLACKFGYKCEYHIITLNRTLSRKFIKIRQNEKGKEGGRVIKNYSEKFFYKQLFPSFKYISKIDNLSNVKIWSPFYIYPFCFKNLHSAKSCYKKLRKLKNRELISKEKLIKFRRIYFKNLED